MDLYSLISDLLHAMSIKNKNKIIYLDPISLFQHSYMTLNLPASSNMTVTMTKRCISVQEITKNLKLFTEEPRKVEINSKTLR